MKSITLSLVLLITMLASTASKGADIVLREQATQNGSIIRLGDIADITARTSAEMHNLSSTPLLAAPAPGTQQFLNAAQVRELLLARGISLENSSLLGAKVVQIGSANKLQAFSSATSETSVEKTPQEIEQLILHAITNHLQDVSQHYDWRVELALQKDKFPQLINLTDSLVASGARHTRTGRQRFTLTHDGQNHFVYADIAKLQSVVVIKNPIQRGQLIRTADVEIREREGNLPKETLVDLQQAIGKEALRNLPADATLQERHIRAPWQVKRGEGVNVYVRTGGIVIRTRAISKENGAAGDLISVELPEDKKRLNVTVSGPGEVTLYATGGRATDFATLNRDDRRRR